MPTDQAKPGAEPVVEPITRRDMDRSWIVQCENYRCNSHHSCVEFTIAQATESFNRLGWRRINNRVHCPECVEDVTNKEGGDG